MACSSATKGSSGLMTGGIDHTTEVSGCLPAAPDVSIAVCYLSSRSRELSASRIFAAPRPVKTQSDGSVWTPYRRRQLSWGVMADQDAPAIRASDQEREAAVGRLQAACVDGRLTLEEYAQRVEGALNARTRNDLDVLVGDLPIAPVISGDRASVATAILGSVKRTGRWRLGAGLHVRTLLGSCLLDLRDAAISSRMSTIDLDVMLGSVEVVVPVGVEVDVDVSTCMGSRTVSLTGSPAPGAPIIRLTGMVCCGSVTVRDEPTLAERVQKRMRDVLGS